MARILVADESIAHEIWFEGVEDVLTASLTKPMPLLTFTSAGLAIFNYFEETNDTEFLPSLSIMCTTMPSQATMNATLSLSLPLPPNSSETRTQVPMPLFTFTSVGLAIFTYFEENEAKETVFLTSPQVQGRDK